MNPISSIKRWMQSPPFCGTRAIVDSTIQAMHSDWSNAATEPPVVFVIGCPRSGTTWLGTQLGKLPDTLYLNEPRWLWSEVDPRWNCYSSDVNLDSAMIHFSAKDVTHDRQIRAWNAFSYLQRDSNVKVVFEKSPTNTARIEWLNGLFPQAKFIFLTRDPNDVALSLEKALSNWFPKGWKGSPQWQVWDRHFQDFTINQNAWETCQTDYERGLVLWSELNQIAKRSFEQIDKNRWMQIRYCDFGKNNNLASYRILEFLDYHGSRYDSWVAANAKEFDTRSIGKINGDRSAIERIIGHEMLEAFGFH